MLITVFLNKIKPTCVLHSVGVYRLFNYAVDVFLTIKIKAMMLPLSLLQSLTQWSQEKQYHLEY